MCVCVELDGDVVRRKAGEENKKYLKVGLKVLETWYLAIPSMDLGYEKSFDYMWFSSVCYLFLDTCECLEKRGDLGCFGDSFFR